MQDNDTSDSIKFWEFLDCLSDYLKPEQDLCSIELISQQTEQFNIFIIVFSIYNNLKIKIIR
jgi:hypothetical protein